MKKCLFCGAEMEDNLTVCPACEKEQPSQAEDLSQDAPVDAVEEATPVTVEAPEAVEAATPASEEALPEDSAAMETAPESPVKKGITGASAVALAVAAVVLLAAILAVLILNGRDKTQVEAVPSETAAQASEATQPTQAPTIPADGNPDDVTCKGSYTVSDVDAKDAAAQVVAHSGEHALTNGQLQVHYWLAVQNFYAQYGTYAQYLGLDHTQGLDTQSCPMVDNETWQQYFLAQALDSWEVYTAIYQQAEEAGFQMPADSQTQLDEMEEGLAETAANNGFDDVETMLQRNFGPGSSLQDYLDFWQLYFLSNGYYSQVAESFTATDGEIESFFNAHEAEYAENGLDKTTKTVDVRHILVLPEGATVENVTTETFSDEAWAAGEAKAQEILDQWLSGDKTEDSFALLANENSADTGSNTNGGLYTGVSQGQMVTEFNDWCFDDNRQVGDYGIVKTQFGYHIMLFCGSETLWQSQAKEDLLTQKTNDFISEARAAAEATIDYSAIKLGFVDMSE